MRSAPRHSALDSVHMEKTPRRLTPSGSAPPPPGSVVVDPTSQAPSSGPSSSRSGRAPASGGARRKPEATLVLEARRVDTLRRQVVERQRAEQKGRRRQMVLWGLAGAGAVLLGGWLATRLSPKDANHGEAPLVLGRSDEDPGAPTLEPARADEENQAAAAGEPTRDRRRGTSSVRAVAPVGAESEDTGPPSADAPPPEASAPAPEVAAERDPDEPKMVGDWGDGFEGAAHREGGSRSAVNLDELPTE